MSNAMTPEDVPNLEMERRERALARNTQADLEAANPVAMFERLARDPSVDVEKLERLIAMQERIMRHTAKAAFDAAFSEMQNELPIIDERGQIVVNGVVRSKYARHEDIQEAVKPILARHGFSINHHNKRSENGKLLVIGVLRHRCGHSEDDEFECAPDASGGKNDIQALGSTREYGRRYTTISLLNIVTRGVDNDGASKPKDEPKAPDGFQVWWDGMADVVPEGVARYRAAWKASPQMFCDFVFANLRDVHEARKAKAEWHDKQKAGAA